MVSFHIHDARATETNEMGEESMWITMAVFGIGSMVFFGIGMIADYSIGYRHGTVAGELAAFKRKLRRSDHDQYRRSSKRSPDEAEFHQSGSP